MIREPEITVGLITDGLPEIDRTSSGIRIRNLLIGEGFHWQTVIEAIVKGEITVCDEPQGNIRIVNRLPVESYLESVVGSEMNPDAPAEFLKAHAVISRGWAIRKTLYPKDRHLPHSIHHGPEITEWEESGSHTGFDVCSDDHCQRYQGWNPDINKAACLAVQATRGLALTDARGTVADTRFSKCCGGRTEVFRSCWSDTDLDYLKSVQDPWCDLSGMDHASRHDFLKRVLKDYDRTTEGFHDWTATVSSRTIRQRINDKYGTDIGEITGLSAVERGASGRITRLLIQGADGQISVGKTLAIRRLLAADCLKSSWFEAERTADGFHLKGHGWGHGVGLCQIGAARMASEGKGFREILEHYYPNTHLTKLYE